MKNTYSHEPFNLTPVGIVVSQLTSLDDCPLQESENAPEAYLEIYNAFTEAIKDIAAGDKLIILTWLHLADRETVTCYMRKEVGSKEFGVFSTRSPNRPNPIGIHIVTVLEVISDREMRIFPMEALNGTPVIDIKPIM